MAGGHPAVDHTRDALGGMAAQDGPVPVRTLAHAARLLRETRQLSRYGIAAGEPALDYPRLLDRVREVTADVGASNAISPRSISTHREHNKLIADIL